ncbi:uncharacterized protein LOC126835973 [Adelges cooleyi]|uniref:uncharacterized protein LOC126835973 n=1 Tax=Adelges cooleyi TaxID=133065 RepID=UPI00217F9A4E|nr:uncharacterized protein LOC126835973 [Adelges cooleyi]
MNIKFFIISSYFCLYFCIARCTDEVLEEIYAGAQRYMANELERISECRESGTFDRNTIRSSFWNRSSSEELDDMDVDQMLDVTEPLPTVTRMSKDEFKELIRKPKFTDEQLDEIYDAVLKDAESSDPVKFCLIEKRVGMNHQLLGYKLIFNQFPDIRLSKEEFAISMKIKEIKLPVKILDEIYSTLREDAGKNSVKFYIIERIIGMNKMEIEVDIGLKIENIPKIRMSKEELKELMQAKINYLTDEQLEKLYEAVQNDDKGCVTKRSVEHYLCKKTIGSKHVLYEQEIKYVINRLPSDIRISKEEFKESMKIQLFKLTDEQLDYIFDGTISYVNRLYTTYSSFGGEKVDGIFIDRYLRDNLSKYVLTFEDMTYILQQIPSTVSKNDLKDLLSWWPFSKRSRF